MNEIKYFVYSLVTISVLLVDQITKALVLSCNALPIVLIPNFFSLNLVFNTGSIWGLGSAYTKVLAFLGVFMLFVFSFFVKKLKDRTDIVIVLGCLSGGVIGNTLDRLLRGNVVDFLDFYVRSWHWPCFNVADIAITCSCLYLFFVRGYK